MITQEQFTIKLERRGDLFVWCRNDGQRVSPVFRTAEAAHYFAGRVPFLTDEEWKEFHPLNPAAVPRPEKLKAEPEVDHSAWNHPAEDWAHFE